MGAAALSAPVLADVLDASWLGGNSTWYNAAQWSGGVAPDNTASATYRATIPSGTVNTGTPSTPAISVDSLTTGQTSYLEVRRALQVNGSAEVNGTAFVLGRLTIGTGGSLQGTGTIIVGSDSPPTSASRLIQSDGLTIPAGFSVRVGGSNTILGLTTQPFVNRGYIFGGATFFDNRAIITGSTLSNLGTIEANHGAISFGGTFTRADLGNLVWTQGGTFGIAGTLVNDNQTLFIDAAHPWELNDGTIHGGTIQIAGGAALQTIFPTTDIAGYGGTLDNTIVNGRIVHFGATSLNFSNGVIAGNAEIVLGGGGFPGPARVATSSASLTVGSTVFIHGGGVSIFSTHGAASGVGNGAGQVINNGKIRAESNNAFGQKVNEFDVLGTSIQNNGTLEVGTSAFMYISGNAATSTTLTFGEGPVLSVNLDSAITPLQINGVLDLSAVNDRILLTGGEPFVSYKIISTTGGVIGSFNRRTTGYLLSLSGNDLYAISFLPEPATGIPLLIGFALAPMRRVSSRRRQ